MYKNNYDYILNYLILVLVIIIIELIANNRKEIFYILLPFVFL